MDHVTHENIVNPLQGSMNDLKVGCGMGANYNIDRIDS